MPAVQAQTGILAPLPPHARHLFFACTDVAQAATALQHCRTHIDGDTAVAGLGAELVAALGQSVPGLRSLTAPQGTRVPIPATPAALWIWLRGNDRGMLLQRTWALEAILGPAFRLEHAVDTFVHDGGRDLTGYEDGTENPQAEAATATAVVSDGVLAGSSFVAVQQWQHDMAAFARLGRSGQDAAIGRRRSDNEEIDDAPASAHVHVAHRRPGALRGYISKHRHAPWP